jgi:integrase
VGAWRSWLPIIARVVYARDAVILLLGFSAGLRITEAALITIADVMFPSGKLRVEVSLRAAITKGCRQRCVYLSSGLRDAIERYLAFRLERELGVCAAERMCVIGLTDVIVKVE